MGEAGKIAACLFIYGVWRPGLDAGWGAGERLSISYSSSLAFIKCHYQYFQKAGQAET